MTEKIIIENHIEEMPMIQVLEHISFVINQGKISETGAGKQYCFVNVFKNGVVVSAFKNKKSDRFVVHYRKDLDKT